MVSLGNESRRQGVIIFFVNLQLYQLNQAANAQTSKAVELDSSTSTTIKRPVIDLWGEAGCP